MRVLLIKPPATFYKTQSDYSPYEPLGIMYLAAYLRQYGDCEVSVLDASARYDLGAWEGEFFRVGLPNAAIAARIERLQPDIIGISAMFTIHSKGVHDVAQLVKDIDPTIPVVVGGAHASAFPEWVLEDVNVDAVVKGEGELTLLEIVECVRAGKSFQEVDGIVCRVGGRVVESQPRRLVDDLDVLPSPAWDAVDMQSYLYEPYNHSHSMTPPRATIVSSRGCPYRCTFCSIHSLWKHSYRMHDPGRVVDEIEHLVENYGVREIAFFDDNLSISRKRMLAICDQIIARELRIRWCTPNGVAIWTLDEECIARMRASGCYKLTFGIETGSADTQRFIRKTYIDLDRARELVAYCSSLGIWTHSSFIIGFPYETEDDIMQTIDYAVDCGVDMASFFIATPYPGTELYDIYRKEGLLPEFGKATSLEWFGTVNTAMCGTRNFSRAQLEGYVSNAKKRVYRSLALRYLNPLRLIPKLGGISELRYFLRQAFAYSRRVL